MVAQGSRTLKLSILADVDNLKKSLNEANGKVDNSSSKMSDFSKKASLAFAAVGAAAVAMAGKIAVDAIKAASDLGETISKVGVLFGDSAKKIETFADGAAQALGQTKQQALDAAANFAIFGKSAGLSGDSLVKFSTSFVSLAADLASFNNVSQDEAINAIGSALRGEAEPLRKFGVLLDEATLKNAALSLGLISTTKDALTPQQKVLAAQKVIFEQTTAAQGDFARTSGGLANQTKILTAELENTKLIIGEALLPIVLELTTAFSEKVVPLIKQFAQGLTGGDGLNEGLTESEKKARLFGSRIKSLIEIVISLKDELILVAGVIATVFLVSKIAAGVTATIALIKSLILAYNALKASAIVTGVATAFALNPLLGVGAVALAAGVLAGANALANKGNVDTSKLGASTGAIPFASGFGAPATTGTSTGIVNAGVVVAAAASENLTGQKGGTTGNIGEAMFAIRQRETGFAVPTVPSPSGGFTDSQNAARLIAAAQLQNAPQINLTVNGAMDAEGTARTIVDTLNNSFYRGTGGAGNFQVA